MSEVKRNELDPTAGYVPYSETLHGRLMARFTLEELKEKQARARRKGWFTEEDFDVYRREASKYYHLCK